MITTVLGDYLQYVAVNFQRLHNKFGRVGYVNLTDDQRNMKEMPIGIREMPRSMRKMPRSMREIPRRMKDARRKADS